MRSLLLIGLLVALAVSVTAVDEYCGETSCYQVLNVTRTDPFKKIKRSFYKISLKYHPDKNPDEAGALLFTNAKIAYDTLKTKDARAKYDQWLDDPTNRKDFGKMSTKYAPKSDVRWVVLMTLLFCTMIHWFLLKFQFQSVRSRALKDSRVLHVLKNVRLAQFEKKHGASGKKHSNKGKKKQLKFKLDPDDDFSDLVLTDYVKLPSSPPVFPWDILPIAIVVPCWRFAKTLWKFHIMWFFKHTLFKMPLTEDEERYAKGIPTKEEEQRLAEYNADMKAEKAHLAKKERRWKKRAGHMSVEDLEPAGE